MSAGRRKGARNAWLLFGVVVSNTLYHTPLGLEGSIWNPVSLALSLLFLLTNAGRIGKRAFLYGLPVVFVLLSTIVHYSELPASGFRSALATSAGFALLWLSPVKLDHRLLHRFVVWYLTVGAVLSLFNINRMGSSIGNPNFNVNPASAAYYFYVCGMLSLFFIRSRMRWPLVWLFGILMITTQTRAGTAVYALSLVIYYLLRLSQNERAAARLRAGALWVRRRLSGMRLAGRLVLVVPMGLAAVYMVSLIVPVYVQGITRRFEGAYGTEGVVNNRDFIWDAGMELIRNSPEALVFGFGPATIATLIGTGTHSSYLEAFGSYGAVFVVASVLAVLVRMLSLNGKGHWPILVVGLPLLLYGITDTFLFSGVRFMWHFFLLFGIYLESIDTSVRRRRLVPRPDIQHGALAGAGAST